MIRNPVLKGFNPDPSIVRVERDYFIATSTFEWYPGVQIHHSRDLVSWRLVARPLDRASQLDLRGEPANMLVIGPVNCRATGSYSCSRMPSNAGCFGLPPTLSVRCRHCWFRNHFRPSSSWKSDGSNPEEFR